MDPVIATALQQATGVPPPPTARDYETYISHFRQNYIVKARTHRIWDWAGVVAGVLTLVAVIMQIVRVYQLRSACAISYYFLIGNLGVQALWLTYGIGNGYWVNILTGSVGVIVIAYMLILKIKYDGNESACKTISDAS